MTHQLCAELFVRAVLGGLKQSGLVRVARLLCSFYCGCNCCWRNVMLRPHHLGMAWPAGCGERGCTAACCGGLHCAAHHLVYPRGARHCRWGVVTSCMGGSWWQLVLQKHAVCGCSMLPCSRRPAFPTSHPSFYMRISATMHLHPSCPPLRCAELATTFPENSGYVAWVTAAFGPFWGFQVRLADVVCGSISMSCVHAYHMLDAASRQCY